MKSRFFDAVKGTIPNRGQERKLEKELGTGTLFKNQGQQKRGRAESAD